MLSLEEAVEHARSAGLKMELIVVLDNSDASSTSWFNAYQAHQFTRYELIDVNNGALGTSRNQGIEQARGRHIMTYDEDDLVSFNYILDLFDAAEICKCPTLVFPEYLFGFGSHHQLCRFSSFPELSRLAFLAAHPLISRYLAHREIYEQLSYDPLLATDVFAFEDWHFNCQALARSVDIKIAPDTILYYRQRASGLAQLSSARSTRQIPPSRLFEPLIYRKICAQDYQAYIRAPNPSSSAEEVRAAFLTSQVCREAGRAANLIDSGIDIGVTPQIIAYTNADYALNVGAAYFELCEKLIDRKFTDIVLLPYIRSHGDEGWILDLLLALDAQSDRSVLVLTGHGGARHEGIFRLSSETIILDLFNRFEWITSNDREILTLKLIQSVGGSCCIHLSPSNYSYEFYRKYASLLEHNLTIFYYVISLEAKDRQDVSDQAFAFVERNGARFDRIVTIEDRAHSISNLLDDALVTWRIQPLTLDAQSVKALLQSVTFPSEVPRPQT